MTTLTRREFLRHAAILGLSASALALLNGCGILPTSTPTPKIFHLGELGLNTRESRRTSMDAFHWGLRELGYIAGQNIVIESRYADGEAARLPQLTADLINLKVDIILAEEGPSAVAAKQVTSKIPIVVAQMVDPVGAGLIVSFAHPGVNVTGISSEFPGIYGKRLELLLQAVPGRSHVAVLYNRVNLAWERNLTETQVAGNALGVQVQPLEIGSVSDFESAFQAVIRERADALISSPSPFFTLNRTQLIDLAAKSRLPAIFTTRDSAANGGLMSYGVSFDGEFRSAATYVDKILKGAKPADLPVELPTKFDFVINLKTAKELGLTIPQAVLALATEVIQ